MLIVASGTDQNAKASGDRQLVDKKTAAGEAPAAVSVNFQPAMDFKVKSCVNPKSDTKVTAETTSCLKLR